MQHPIIAHSNFRLSFHVSLAFFHSSSLAFPYGPSALSLLPLHQELLLERRFIKEAEDKTSQGSISNAICILLPISDALSALLEVLSDNRMLHGE
jgi:hypothetical protein